LRGIEKLISRDLTEQTSELRHIDISQRLDNRGVLTGYCHFTIYLSIRDENLFRPEVAMKAQMCKASCENYIKSASSLSPRSECSTLDRLAHQSAIAKDRQSRKSDRKASAEARLLQRANLPDSQRQKKECKRGVEEQ
jgi:hypothetical protein